MNTKNNKKSDIQRAFNKAAETYANAAVVYQEIGQRLLSRLEYTLLDPQVILDAGCGLGNFSEILALRYPNAQIIALDFSENMLKNNTCHKDIHKILGDMEKLPLLSESIDLIFANQSIQDVTHISALFQEFHRVLRPQGALYFSTLGPDSFKELKNAWAIVDTYGHVNELHDLHNLGDELLTQQFIQPVIDMEYITVHYPTPKILLKDLKEQGSYNIHPIRRTGLMGQDALAYLYRGLEEQRNDSGKIPMTYEVVYGHAWRGERKAKYNAETGETFISVDMLRRSLS